MPYKSKEDRKKRIKQWHKDNPHKQKEYYRKTRTEVLEAYGNCCTCCGETQYEFLALDHIDGGGNAHRKAIGSRWIYHDIKKRGFPPGFQVLCHNCNQAKGFYGVCPHMAQRSITRAGRDTCVTCGHYLYTHQSRQTWCGACTECVCPKFEGRVEDGLTTLPY